MGKIEIVDNGVHKLASRSFVNNGRTSEVVKPLYRGSLHTNVVNK